MVKSEFHLKRRRIFRPHFPFVVKGAKSLGLSGEVSPAVFRNLFKGFSPDGEYAWVQNAGQASGYHKRCPGWDLTFSPPKSVSVLWSQAPEETRKVIEEIHREAVKVALTYLEEVAGFTRRGHGGKVWEKAEFVFAIFEHGTSRAQDPQIHSHAILFNLSIRADGTTGAVRSNAVFENKVTAGILYRAAMAAMLRVVTGPTGIWAHPLPKPSSATEPP